MTEIDKYVFFYGTDWPSNFATAMITIKDPFFTEDLFNAEVPYIMFLNSESYYQSWKARMMNDKDNFYKIAHAVTPGESKKLARNVDLNVKEWDSKKDDIMYETLLLKFTGNKDLLNKFLDEKYDDKIFVEASPTDRYWGIGFNEDRAIRHKELYGVTPMDDPNVELGQNMLGKLLNKLRKTLLFEKETKG